jgi:hypothetical protein
MIIAGTNPPFRPGTKSERMMGKIRMKRMLIAVFFLPFSLFGLSTFPADSIKVTEMMKNMN